MIAGKRKVRKGRCKYVVERSIEGKFVRGRKGRIVKMTGSCTGK